MINLSTTMKKNLLNVSVLFAIAISANAQEPVVMTVNDKPVTKSEFEAVFNKNNTKETTNSKSM